MTAPFEQPLEVFAGTLVTPIGSNGSGIIATFHGDRGAEAAAHAVKVLNANAALLKVLKHLVRWHDQLSATDIAMAEEAIAQAES